MIKANELRIGDWVNIPESGINAVIDIIGTKKVCIDTDRVDLDGNQGCFMCESLNPIPLTSEILKQCGFAEETYHLLSHPHMKCRWVIQNMSGNSLATPFLRFDGTCRPPFISTDVYFLHQLQNIYFALTNKELMIEDLNVERSVATMPNSSNSPD